jgi:hypothetical protein
MTGVATAPGSPSICTFKSAILCSGDVARIRLIEELLGKLHVAKNPKTRIVITAQRKGDDYGVGLRRTVLDIDAHQRTARRTKLNAAQNCVETV